jgi:AcrR family transcriptional regulator
MDCPLQRRWARRKEARPQELLEAALEQFVERGYAATRLEDVARQAGVSKGTLYLYYTNKEELFKAVVRENLVPEIGEAEDLVDQYAGRTQDLMIEFIQLWWERLGMSKLSGITKLIMAESGNFPELADFYHKEVIVRAHAMIARLLERGMASGEFRRVDATEVTRLLVAQVVMLIMWKHSFGPCQREPIDPAHYLASMIDLSLNGLLLRPGAEK